MNIKVNTLSEYYEKAIALNPGLENDEFLDYCYDQACLEFDDEEPGSYVADLYDSPEAKAIISYVERAEEYMEG